MPDLLTDEDYTIVDRSPVHGARTAGYELIKIGHENNVPMTDGQPWVSLLGRIKRTEGPTCIREVVPPSESS